MRKIMTFKEITFTSDKAKYITPSWNDLDELTLQVAQKVIQSKVKFDLIVALAKGAWPMSRSFLDYTNIKELASLGVKFYSGINERLKKPDIYQNIPTSIQDKNILVFDDVADTGESLLFAQEYLLKQGANKVETATLFLKPWSSFVPNFYGTTTDAWIIFPFEKREMKNLLGKNWQQAGKTKEEISKRYQKLGFNDIVVSL